MEYDFDIAVIGSGAGGATAADSLARAGKSVVVIERGRSSDEIISHRTEADVFLKKTPYDDRDVVVNGIDTRLMMGGVTGGGTAVFGGAMTRPLPDDFSPGKYYGDRIPRDIWEWPVQWNEYLPYLEKAERICQVSTPEALRHSESSSQTSPFLPMAKANQRILERSRSRGFHLERLPLAIDPAICLHCDQCAGFPCPTGARFSGHRLLKSCQREGFSVDLRVMTEAIRFVRSPHQSSVDHLELLDRRTGNRFAVRARRYILAAGAVSSPLLLLNSGATHPQTGRNYMFHLSPVVAGFFANRTEGDRTFVKQLCTYDFYFGTIDCPEKMGIVQSLPVPCPELRARQGLGVIPWRARNLIRSRMLPFAGIVEDLPRSENRVQAGSNGKAVLNHEFTDFDRRRGVALATAMKSMLRSGGALMCVGRNSSPREHIGHQCGTLRFGKSPSSAACDPSCRLFEFPDVFVADGSFFPTSLGVGPSLLIAANALRVADLLQKDL